MSGTNICPDCGQDHADQRNRYPVGAKIRTLIDIVHIYGAIKAGARGEVKGHLDNGLASICIDSKPPAVKTFHFPSGVIVVEEPSRPHAAKQAPPSADIWSAICRERSYQDRKYGTVTARGLSIDDYFNILAGEMREADAALEQGDNVNALRELLQVAAVAVAVLEAHGVVEREP